MSASNSTVLRRLCHTPLRDVVRGRINGRLDVAKVIDEALLPDALAVTVRDVTRRTRLWRSERVEVAAELCSHFLDGLASGASSEDLARAFGEPKTTARLIRRAKKRHRPLAWRSLKWIGGACALLVSIYLAIGVRLVLARPVISVDYLAVLTKEAAAVPQDDRAWPLYRQALLELPPEPQRDRSALPAQRVSDRDPVPGEPGWAETQALLRVLQSPLALARQGAARPALGFVVGNGLADEEDAALWPELSERSASSDLMSVFLPHLAELRRLARLLAFDALAAASSGDGATALADVEAMLSLGNHVRETPILISELVSMAIAHRAVQVAGDIVARWPETLDERALARLAHVVGGSSVFAPPSMEGEKLVFRDIVQRLYTDDGDGDGRLTLSGLAMLEVFGPVEVAGALPAARDGGDWPDDALRIAVAPMYAYAIASRREMLDEHERLFGMLEADWRVPMWEFPGSTVDARIEAWHDSRLEVVRYLPLILLMPALTKTRESHERLLVERDALLGALALELQHRRTDSWPASFDALVPELLPWVPLDRFDGAPLRFRIGDDGRPLIYSVGTDRVDDGGVLPRRGPDSRPDPSLAQRWISRATLEKRIGPGLMPGDWILWPRYVEPLEAE